MWFLRPSAVVSCIIGGGRIGGMEEERGVVGVGRVLFSGRVWQGGSIDLAVLGRWRHKSL